jgi:hypothetical protein
MGQDEAFFYLLENGEEKKIRFHDYGEIYDHPGLYEQLFYDRLHCNSPRKIAEILEFAVGQEREPFTQLRVLDFGAGNGMMGEALSGIGVSRLVGVDIIPEARDAAERDRKGLYDHYYVADFCSLDTDLRRDIASWSLNALTVVAALGFGDIPPDAFIEAFNVLESKGWIAFNIKESFLSYRDETGFSKLVRALIFSEYLDLRYLERYRHRLSIDGEPLYYYAIAARKKADVPAGFLDEQGIA